MKRLLEDQWRRRGLQVGLLVGIGLAFAIGGRQAEVRAGGGGDCVDEGECSVKRPNLMIIVDYSTAMNEIFDEDNNLTHWEVAVAGIQQLAQPGSYLSQHTHLALMRFGHDPDPQAPGTPIDGDLSGLVDGQALDVRWDDNQGVYSVCNGQAIIDALGEVDAPMQGQPFGIGRWTRGALEAAGAEIAATEADHPDDLLDPARLSLNLVITHGPWSSPDGLTLLEPADADPSLSAAALYDDQGVATYVVTIGADEDGADAADELAAAGGTMSAVDGDSPSAYADALGAVGEDIETGLIAPACAGGLPRVMVLLDASSSMLNIDGGAEPGPQGATGWDQARDALAGRVSIFDIEPDGVAVERRLLFGLAVFGHDVPELDGVEAELGPEVGAGLGEAKVMVQYGPCMKDNFAWALDPLSSCEAPGCEDPWGGPPITWTFADGTADPPGFAAPTRSHMPSCTGDLAFCAGAGTYTHLGLELLANNQAAYALAAAEPDAPQPANEATTYVNILITDGQYSGYSTDAQVSTALQGMFAAGIETYVIGFGDGVDHPDAITELEAMADWGSGGTESYFDAGDQAELEVALTAIVAELPYDPCCALGQCGDPGPDTFPPEPDPVPPPGDGDGDPGDGDGDPATGDGDGDPATGDGDGDPATGDGDGDPTSSGEGSGEAGTGGESGTGSEDPGLDDDSGCACSSGADGRGGLAPLALAVLGWIARRRCRRAART